MARKYRTVQTVRLYPKKIVVCSRCRHEISQQPFIERITVLTRMSMKKEHICWKCVHDHEGVFLIVSNYPTMFTELHLNNRVFLKLRKPVSLFVEVPHGEL